MRVDLTIMADQMPQSGSGSGIDIGTVPAPTGSRKGGPRKRGRPTKQMVLQRERQQKIASAQRVLGSLDMIEGNMGGVRSFVETVAAAVLNVRSRGGTKKGIRVDQIDVDLARQAMRGVNSAIQRLRASVALGALPKVGQVVSGGSAAMVVTPGGLVASGGNGKSSSASPRADLQDPETQRKLSELTRTLLPSDWRCANCKYVNSFSDGPCGWCEAPRTVDSSGATNGDWDPFKVTNKRKRNDNGGNPTSVSVTIGGAPTPDQAAANAATAAANAAATAAANAAAADSMAPAGAAVNAAMQAGAGGMAPDDGSASSRGATKVPRRSEPVTTVDVGVVQPPNRRARK